MHVIFPMPNNDTDKYKFVIDTILHDIFHGNPHKIRILSLAETLLNVSYTLAWLSGSADRRYRQTSNVRRTSVGNKIVDHSDVVGASPVGPAPTTYSFSTQHPASLDNFKTRRETFKFWDFVRLILEV